MRLRLRYRAIIALGVVFGGLALLLSNGQPTSSPQGDRAMVRGSEYSGDCRADGIEHYRQYSKENLQTIFGPPRSPELEAQLKTVTLLDRPVRVHAKVAVCLEAVERERKAKGIVYAINTGDPLGGIGGYRPRDSQLGDASYHAYGAAIDLNPSQNPYCSLRGAVDPQKLCDSPQPYTVPRELVEVFRHHGFTWGGNWRVAKDYMHFEWHGESV